MGDNAAPLSCSVVPFMPLAQLAAAAGDDVFRKFQCCLRLVSGTFRHFTHEYQADTGGKGSVQDELPEGLQLMRFLGSSTLGRVFAVEGKFGESVELCAKVMVVAPTALSNSSGSPTCGNVLKEIQIMALFAQYENVFVHVKALRGVYYMKKDPAAEAPQGSFDDARKDKAVAFMELQKADLKRVQTHHADKGTSCSTLVRRAVMEGVCLAIYSLHLAGICHLDLKPSNVLLSKEWRVFLTGFDNMMPTATANATKKYSSSWSSGAQGADLMTMGLIWADLMLTQHVATLGTRAVYNGVLRHYAPRIENAPNVSSIMSQSRNAEVASGVEDIGRPESKVEDRSRTPDTGTTPHAMPPKVFESADDVLTTPFVGRDASLRLLSEQGGDICAKLPGPQTSIPYEQLDARAAECLRVTKPNVARSSADEDRTRRKDLRSKDEQIRDAMMKGDKVQVVRFRRHKRLLLRTIVEEATAVENLLRCINAYDGALAKIDSVLLLRRLLVQFFGFTLDELPQCPKEAAADIAEKFDIICPPSPTGSEAATPDLVRAQIELLNAK